MKDMKKGEKIVFGILILVVLCCLAELAYQIIRFQALIGGAQ